MDLVYLCLVGCLRAGASSSSDGSEVGTDAFAAPLAGAAGWSCQVGLTVFLQASPAGE